MFAGMTTAMLAQSMSVGEAFGTLQTVVSLDAVVEGVDMPAEGELRAEALVAGGEDTG